METLLVEHHSYPIKSDVLFYLVMAQIWRSVLSPNSPSFVVQMQLMKQIYFDALKYNISTYVQYVCMY